jgi:hypothetical protein
MVTQTIPAAPIPVVILPIAKERTEPTELPTIRVKLRRPIYHSAYHGQKLAEGDILKLHYAEVREALGQEFGIALEDFPPAPNADDQFLV